MEGEGFSRAGTGDRPPEGFALHRLQICYAASWTSPVGRCLPAPSKPNTTQ